MTGSETKGNAISDDDLDELDFLAEAIRMAAQSGSLGLLFEYQQRIKHITLRIRGLAEE